MRFIVVHDAVCLFSTIFFNRLLVATLTFLVCGVEHSYARELPQHEVTANSADFALRESLLGNDYEGFKSSLLNGADPTEWLDDSQFGWVMCAATETGREEYLKLLIDTGHDVNFRQADISTAISLPLTCAVRFGNLKALKMLVNAGANPAELPCDVCANRKPMSVMSEAIIVRKYELAVWLFDKGSYSDAQLRTDVGLLERQRVNESSIENTYRLELVDLLREKGYDVTPWTKSKDSN